MKKELSKEEITEVLTNLFAVSSSLNVSSKAIYHTIYTETRENAQEELLYSLQDITEHLAEVVGSTISILQGSEKAS